MRFKTKEESIIKMLPEVFSNQKHLEKEERSFEQDRNMSPAWVNPSRLAPHLGEKKQGEQKKGTEALLFGAELA
jgi:hypothetical protein